MKPVAPDSGKGVKNLHATAAGTSPSPHDSQSLSLRNRAAPDGSKKQLKPKTMKDQAAEDLKVKMDAQKKARKWKSEIELAGKREHTWREDAKKIIDRYRGTNAKKNGFNILWANTEILRPAIYNSTPKPDVRRRFRDADPIGKAVAEVLERSLYVITDHYATDCAFKLDSLDSLLPGRGISRVRYLAKIEQVPNPIGDIDEDDPDSEQQYDERLTYEQCCIEHVDWQDFRHGFGRQWEEVTWVAFRHKLTKAEAEDKFGEDAITDIKFTTPTTEGEQKQDTSTEVEKQSEFWEIWDKNSRTVFFTNTDTPKCLYPLDTPNGEPPLDFYDFFPCPQPLIIIEDTSTLTPIPIFSLYKNQADELDKISIRIFKLVNDLRLRGAYDTSLPEMGDLMNAEDGSLVPISGAAAWRDNGGLDKAITWLPIGPAAQVLEQLTLARENAKQVIYEITGISDIVRGASVASETATAQQIKANYASARLKKMQSEVQRYTRDILRLCAEVVASKFGADTLAQMTGLPYLTQEQKQQQMMMAQMQAQQTGQPPPPDPQMQMPTWEDIVQILRNDALRGFKVDVETDSTVAASVEGDMQSLSQVITALGQTMSVFGPLVQEGVMPLDAAKQIILAMARRAKLGLPVEDSIEAMTQPPPKQPDPPPPDHSMEVAQVKAQSDGQIKQMEIQANTQREQMLSQAKQQAEQSKLQFDAMMDERNKAHDQQMEQMKIQAENLRAATQLETQRQIADAGNQTQLMIAELAAKQKAEMATQQQAHDQSMAEMQTQHEQSMQSMKAESDQKLATMAPPSTDKAPTAADYKAEESGTAIKELIAVMSKPKRVIRDENGKISGVE